MKEKVFKSYTVTKTGKFGSLINKISKLLEEYKNKDYIKVSTMKGDLLELEATDYGYTVLRLVFWKPAFLIQPR